MAPTHSKHLPRFYKEALMHPVIPLERLKERRVPKHELIVFNLKTNPGDTNSTQYEMNIPIYKDGASPEDLLMLLRSRQM